MRIGYFVAQQKGKWQMKNQMIVVGVVLVMCGSAFGVTVVTDLTPLTAVADETGFGTLHSTLGPQAFSSVYGEYAYSGTITSRVYVDSIVTFNDAVTFVWEVQIDGTANTPVEDMTIAAAGAQLDLRIAAIIAGTNGYITGSTNVVPAIAEARNNDYPTADELFYEWASGSQIGPDDSATLYVTTTGGVDVGQVDVAFQDLGGATATVLAPVDDPDSPDMNIPEPATLTLVSLGFVAMLRRRRNR